MNSFVSLVKSTYMVPQATHKALRLPTFRRGISRDLAYYMRFKQFYSLVAHREHTFEPRFGAHSSTRENQDRSRKATFQPWWSKKDQTTVQNTRPRLMGIGSARLANMPPVGASENTHRESWNVSRSRNAYETRYATTGVSEHVHNLSFRFTWNNLLVMKQRHSSSIFLSRRTPSRCSSLCARHLQRGMRKKRTKNQAACMTPHSAHARPYQNTAWATGYSQFSRMCVPFFFSVVGFSLK
jgi:hypothetical protein